MKTMIATPETDRENRLKYYAEGMEDRMSGKPPKYGPEENNLVYKWYMRGYNEAMVE